jgi:transcriptional regulator with XRE-family HTH domain
VARWKPLPHALEAQARELVVRLRELKDQLGLGTAALARKTAYSRSSWVRYLNGGTLPPRGAVEALGRLANADQARLLALWELAEQAKTRRGRAGETDDAPEDRADPVTGLRRPRAVVVAGAVAVLVLVGVMVWLAIGGRTARSSSSSAAVQPNGYRCDYTVRDGRLYAGHTANPQRLVVLNLSGEDVVEVQCLLVHHGFDPGRVDGMFGEHTEKAVKELQRTGGAVEDGKVGPQTWALLRA